MRTAIVVAGAFRQYRLCKHSWNILGPGEKHLFTWDKTYQCHSDSPEETTHENIGEAMKDRDFLSYHIYHHHDHRVYMDFGKAANRQQFFWHEAHSYLKDKGYEFIIIVRPDLFVFSHIHSQAGTTVEFERDVMYHGGFVDEAKNGHDIFVAASWERFDDFIRQLDENRRGQQEDVHHYMWRMWSMQKEKGEIREMPFYACPVRPNALKYLERVQNEPLTPELVHQLEHERQMWNMWHVGWYG